MTSQHPTSGARAGLLALALVLLPGVASAATFVSSTPIAGDSVPVTLVLEDASEGDAVEVSLSIPEGSGDLLGLFGNSLPESLVPGLAVVDASGVVTQWQFAANQVWKVGGGNVMTPVPNWDWGLRFGTAGGAGGAVTQVTFRLTAPGLEVASLTEAFNQGWRFGVRIQGTGGPEGSAKIGIASSAPPQGQAPGVAIAAPADGALLATSEVVVAGSFTGTSPVAVAVNGVGAGLTGSQFEAFLSLPDGPHALTAVATNAFGTASDAVAVTVDTTPPVVTIVVPEPGALTAAASLVVSGTVADASPIASVLVNGVAAALDGDAFSAEVPLALGENEITATATDAAGHVGAGSVVVTRGVPPAISISAPADGFETLEETVTVTGSVQGTAPLDVAVSGTPAIVSGESFLATVPLGLGSNTLVATASNPLGSASDSVSGTRVEAGGGLPLTISILTPPDQAFVSSAVIPVEGIVSDPEAQVSVNAVAAGISGTRYRAPAVRLVEGPNLLVATATRGADTATAQATVVYNEPPRVVITAPADGARLRVGQTDVTGVVDDLAAHVDVNGVEASVGPGGRFVARAVPLVPGPNPLQARAIDLYGAIGEDRVEVVRDDDSAGRLRMVLVIPERRRRGVPPGPASRAVVVAEDGAEFAAALSSIGFPAVLFVPPIEVPAIGFNTFFAYLLVFAEGGRLGEPVEIPALSDAFAVFSNAEPLRPMSELEDELSGLDGSPEFVAEVIPRDFTPDGFALFSIFLGSPN